MKVLNRINMPAFIVLIPYPILLIILSFVYNHYYDAGWKEFIIATIGHYGSNIAIGIGMHRLWSHASYKAKMWFHYLLAIFSSGCLQGPALAWASDHRFHHAYPDGELDPHSPLKYKNRLLGFLWAHIGWMLVKDPDKSRQIDRATLKLLGRNSALVMQLKHYWKLAAFMNIIPPIIFGFAMFGEFSFKAAAAGFIFIGLGRAFQQQMTFSVNSVTHSIGQKKYATDSSYDVFWLAPLLLGENWHNFHHAFGQDYRNGHKFYHLDVHKWIIWSLSKIGVASDLVITSETRIAAKIKDVKELIWKNDIISAKQKAGSISQIVSEKLLKISEFKDSILMKCSPISENSLSSLISSFTSSTKKISHDKAKKIIDNFASRLQKIQNQSKDLSIKAAKITEHSSEMINFNIVNKISKSLNNLEASAKKIGICISSSTSQIDDLLLNAKTNTSS